MRLNIILAFAASALAIPLNNPQALIEERALVIKDVELALSKRQSGICFDDFDCFASGGKCVKASGSFLGSCASATPAPSPTKSGSGSVPPTPTKTGSVPPTPTKTGSFTPTPTSGSGSPCFDNFDCFFSGGNCVKSKGSLLGKCAPKPKE